MAEEKMGFEQKLARLEEVVKALENSATSLDDSLKLFEEGVSLVRDCSSLLDNAEKRVKVLTRDQSSGEVVEADLGDLKQE